MTRSCLANCSRSRTRWSVLSVAAVWILERKDDGEGVVYSLKLKMDDLDKIGDSFTPFIHLGGPAKLCEQWYNLIRDREFFSAKRPSPGRTFKFKKNKMKWCCLPLTAIEIKRYKQIEQGLFRANHMPLNSESEDFARLAVRALKLGLKCSVDFDPLFGLKWIDYDPRDYDLERLDAMKAEILPEWEQTEERIRKGEWGLVDWQEEQLPHLVVRALKLGLKCSVDFDPEFGLKWWIDFDPLFDENSQPLDARKEEILLEWLFGAVVDLCKGFWTRP